MSHEGPPCPSESRKRYSALDSSSIHHCLIRAAQRHCAAPMFIPACHFGGHGCQCKIYSCSVVSSVLSTPRSESRSWVYAAAHSPSQQFQPCCAFHDVRCTVLYCTVLYYTMLYCTVLCLRVQLSIVITLASTSLLLHPLYPQLRTLTHNTCMSVRPLMHRYTWSRCTRDLAD